MQDFRQLLRVLLAVLPLGVAVSASAQNTVATDKAALVALYNAADGANWTTNANWTSEEPLSSWHGVTTNSAGRVTALVLNGNGLEGTLPAALGDLGELEQLDLQNNALGGALPTELADLTNLTTLLLNQSRALTGPLPDGLRELADLETVNIEKTELCAPGDDAFQDWLDTITFSGLICPPAAQSVIDVAVFYTSAAREYAGGIDEIETSIDLMVAETNAAYEAGGVHQRIKLVAVDEVVGYTQQDDIFGVSATFLDRDRLQSPSDGYMDEVHDLRDKVGADIVLLVRSGSLATAYWMATPSQAFESRAFGLVLPDDAIAFAHELGHIMGLQHDRYQFCQASICSGTDIVPFPYAFGYVNQRAFDPNDPESPNPDPTVPATARWRTIMAYPDQCSAAGFSCQWLLRFSNPDQIHPDPGGDPLGKAGLEPAPGVDGPADAVRMLNRTRGYVANFRSPPDITVSFDAEQYTAAEGGAVATVTVRLSAAPTRPIDIPFTATGATGAAASDYSAPRSVTFAAGETEQTFTVTAVDDGVDDDGETVTLTLGHLLPGGVGAGSPATATVTLTDNDAVTGAPSVLSVSLTSDPGAGGYAVGERIEAAVRFDKTVTVTGTPALWLAIGSSSRVALYQGGAREVLTFYLFVASGENDADGVSIPANALIRGSATIQDSTNQNAVLTHSALAGDATHRVDGVKPTVLEAVVDETVLTLTYDEPLAQPPFLARKKFSVASSRSSPFTRAEVMVSGSIVTVSLTDPVLAGDEVTVSFSNSPLAVPQVPALIRDLAGNAAASLVDRAVTNVTEERVYDTDGDGLIEITTLAQLDAVRHDPDGDGVPTAAGASTYRAAFPDAFPETDSQLRCVLECRGYELMADLDFDTNDSGGSDAGDAYWNNGAGWNPLGTGTAGFQATFEGNGHTLRNLFIDRSTTSRVGLFGDTDSTSAIRNVGVTQVNVTGNLDVGGLVGDGQGTITASYATGRVSGARHVGGLVGSTTGTITASYATVRVSGPRAVGGLVGTPSATITGNYATGRVSGFLQVGGLVGDNVVRIRAGYATGRVTGTSEVGGLAGDNDRGSVFYSYWDTLTSGQATGSNGQGQTTTGLQAPTDNTGIYADWDADLWDFGEADEYPVLVVDFDGDGDATWEEFGYQLREGPTLTAEAGVGQVVLSWTAVDATHWTPAANVTYILTRDDGATSEILGEGLSGLTFTDTDVTADTTYTYQVAAVVTGGEATRSALVAATALPNMWLSPTASDPVAAVESRAAYSVTFQGAWTTTVTADGVPSGAHFTTLIGGVHNAGVTFLSEGGMASAGVELMAELGGTSTLANEVRAAEPNALSVLQGSGGNIGPTSPSTISTVTVTSDHPRVTLLTMVAPSPDWFVGVSGLSLLDAQAGWLASLTANLYPWDAGTEEGAEFSLSNPATSPQGTIMSLRGMGKFSDEPIATLTFTRQSVNKAPTFTSDTSFDVNENRTSAVATVLAEDPNSGDAVTYAITGGADSSQFQIVEATGVLTFNTPPNYERPADVTSTDPANEAANNEYILTVTATGGTGDRALTAEQMITVTVRNLEEAGTVSFSRVGSAVRARLSDPDGGVSSASWQWARSSDRTTGWVDITGATSARYTPSSDDEEMYLRATVSYNDGQGSGKQAQGVSTNEIAPPDLEITTLVSGLSIPWGITFAPDGTMLFTQRAGVLSSRLADGTVQTVTADFSDLFAVGETGLMGIVVDPGFSSNRRFYTCQGHTGPEVQVIAWTINTAYTEATRVADPLVGGMPAATGRHGGCRLRFGPQGYLWIATGDAATGAVPQDLTSLGGKVLRVNASTGEAAPGNPFGSRVYTYGHRNLQGLALRPDTNQMWSVEHGPSVDDEINLLVVGRNYGWDPVPGYNEGVSMTDFVKFPDALKAKWSSGSPTLATSGGIFLEGEQWGVWEGRLAVATLKDSKLRLFEFTPGGEFVSQVIVPQLDGDYGRLRTPMMGPDGALYVTTSSGTDQILRIAKDATPPAVSSLAINSDPGADRIYAPEDEIQATVTFNEPVDVERTPRLVLRVGSRNRPAGYLEGTGTTELVFGYEVVTGDEDTDGVSIDANSLSLNGGTIKDRSKNSAELGHDGLAADAGHKVDGAGPDLSESNGAEVDGTTLTLTFDEPLDGSSTPQASAFRVTGGDTTRMVADVALSGSMVLLTLDPAVEHGETGIRVSYTVPTGMGTSPLQDVLGNEADRLSNVPVTNETPDTTPPTVSKVEITSNPGTDRTYAADDEIQVTVTFSETVEVSGTPQLSLELGRGSRTATYEGGTGTAALVFAYEVSDGESDTDGVGVEADSLSGGTITDEAQNPAVPDHDGLAADADHKVDGIKPRLAASGGAVVNGTTLTLTYNEPLDGSSTPETGDFTVTGGDQARTVSRVSVSGSTVTLTLEVRAEHLEVGIEVSYTPGTNKVRDVPGNEAEALSREPVTNETPDTTPPEVGSLRISSNPGADQTYAAEDEIEVTVRFSEAVEVEGTPQLRLRVGSRTRTAGYDRGTGTAVLVFVYEVADGDEDSDGVSIEAGRIALNGGKIEDEADNPAELAHEALAAQADHKVDGVKPAFVSAAVDGSSLTLTYGEALDGGSRPAPGDFTVEVDGAGRSVSGVSISGSVVTLTLDPAVEHGDTGIRVSYTPGTNPIRDEVGNDAQGLSNRAVTNTTDEPNTAPEITTRGPLSVGENQALARRLQARDSDAGDEVTGWAIVGGADRGRFAITSDTGELSFREVPDYESPADVASGDPVSGLGDNEYVVTVQVKSGAGARQLTAAQTFLVRVTDGQEPPEVPEAPDISGETADSLEVSWTEPDNTGPTITDYDVQYRETGTGAFTDGGHDGPGLSLTLSGLKEGTDYEVQVRAGNEEGTSGWSDSGEGMTVTPLTLVMASGTDPPVSGPFTVRFIFSEVVSGFSRNEIETEQVAEQDPACRDSQGNAVPCGPVIGALQTVDERVFSATVTPGTTGVENNYTLRLRVPADTVNSAASGQLNEEGMLEVRVAPPGVTLEMSSTGLKASGGNGTARLSWNSPSDNAGSAIIRYEYRYQAVGEAWSEWENAAAGTRGVTVEGLINGQEYVFEVRAVNALGKGGAETVQATPERRIARPPPPPGGGGGGGGGGGLLFPPEAPLGLMAMPGDGAVRLEWSPPESDGGTAILRYEYRLKEGRGEFGEWTPIEDSAPGEVNASGYTVGELENGTVYVFELRAVNLVDEGPETEAVEVVMGLDRAYWSNFRAEDLEGGEASLEHTPFGGVPRSLRLRFGAGLRFEESELDGEGEVTGTRMGSYGYRYTSQTTGELRLDYDEGESCGLRMTFRGVGAGSYSYRCGGALQGQGSFRLTGRNRVPEITSTGPFEVMENTTTVVQLEAADPDEGDEVTGYGIAGGADGALFAVDEETGELRFREAPDFENPGDVESAEPESGAGDNEYVVVVEVRSGEGERERKGQRAIRVRVTDEEEPPEITSVGRFEVVENQTRVGQLEAVDQDKQDEVTGYGIAGGADGGLFAVDEETGELRFREAPDYENPGDVESAEPESGAGDNEYIVVVEVSSGEGERERKGERAIRVRVADEEEPPEITGLGMFEVVENTTRVGQMEAMDPDEGDEVTGYGIAGGADGGLFAVDEETGELRFREAPDYENPGDVESAEPESGAGDNEYIVVVEVSSGEGERERKGERAIRVRVSDEEEPPEAPAAPAVTPEGSDSLKVSWTEPENRGPAITDYEVRYREEAEEGYSDGGHEGTGLMVTLSGLKEKTDYEVQVRAVSEEGRSEWSEPGEGRTGMEEAETEDPADFTGEDLEGRRLTLRLEGGEGAAGIVELRFGEGNRFVQIESGGEQAATSSEEAASRSGIYTYERTGPGRATVRLDYDDGSSCELRLSFTESGVGGFVYDCGEGEPAEGSFRLTTGSLFVPVILSSAGRNNSFFTSELTLTNRGEQDVSLYYTYTAERGGGSGTASEVLPAGRQRVKSNALGYLIGLGVPIPETGNRIGTLRVEVPLGSEVEAVVRTTTVVPDGRAGLAYLGVAEEEGFTEAVYLCGLRQNSRDRSNLAFQNMGAPEEGAITLRATVYSGEASDTSPRVLEDITLEPGGFHQYSPVLGVLDSTDGDRQGYVKVERVEGEAPFYAYGVINDQANSDGSFVFPVTASSLEGTRGQILPVIVETGEFRSELTVTNFSEEPSTLDFRFVAEGIESDDKTAGFRMSLEAGEQQIIPEVVEDLRRQGVAGLGTTRGFYLGPVFVTAEEGDLSGIVIGARTGSQGGGGSYSVFYNAVPEGEAFTEEAWVDGLQQNEENRSNLALVNTGEVDGSESIFHLEIYDGETGMLVETVVTGPIPARRWHQINGILGSYAPETRQGYIRIEKVAGANPFLAYGVVNDGGAPGKRSGDGAYLPARE